MLFELARKLLCPFEQIEDFVPRKGKILDVGCGHGIFSQKMAVKSPQRKVIGIDPSPNKISIALSKTIDHSNLSFENKYIKDLQTGGFQSIVIIDVFYLLPQKEKRRMLEDAKRLLSPKGKLIIKLEVTQPRWLFQLLKIEEQIMVRLLKYTFSSHPKFYYMSVEEYKKLLIELGFKIHSEKILRSRIPYQHPLLIAIK